MELRQYWEILRRRWWLPITLVLLTALLSGWQLRPWQTPASTYHVTMRMLIGVNPLPSSNDTAFDPRYYAWLTSEYLVDDFTEVVRSDLFAKNVSKRLQAQKIELPANLIQGSAVSAKQHRIITLNFSWHNATQLESIANAVLSELTDNAAFYFSQLGSDGALISLLDRPVLGVESPSLRSRIEFPLRLILGLLIGIGFVFLADYLDLSIRSRQELEELGFVVIGEIPKH